MKVGVLDDNVEYAVTTSKHLVRAGFKTSISHTPKEFLRNLDKEIPDIILMDIESPGKKDLEMVEEIRANPKSKYVPIVLITSSALEKDFSEEGMKFGVDWVFTKPLNSKQLIDIITLLNEKYRTKKELDSRIISLEEELFHIKKNGGSTDSLSYDTEDPGFQPAMIQTNQDDDIVIRSSDFNRFMETLDQFQYEMVDLKKINNILREDIQNLKADNVELKNAMAEKEEEIRTFRGQVAEKVYRISTYEEKLAELKIIFDRLFDREKSDLL